MNKVIFNGELVNEDAAQVSFRNKDVQLGLSVFETMLANDGEIKGFDLHMDRLQNGLERLGIGMMEVDFLGLLENVRTLLAANDLSDGRAKVRITAIVDFYMIEVEVAQVRDEVCAVVLSEFIRNERSPVVGIKCGSYAENIMALHEAREAGVDEVIFLNSVGDVAECATANLFIVKDGELFTPGLESGCLPGVTRELVMKAARVQGMNVSEGTVSLADLLDADEVFLTNTQIGVQAVSSIGDLELDECPGMVTKMVRAAYLV
jgi:branched-chain amino acid aminotransferase